MSGSIDIVDGDDEIEKDVYANYIEKYQDIEPHIVKMAYDVHMGVEKNMEIALSPDPSLLIIQVSASCIFDLHLLFFSIVWRQLHWFANKVVYKFLIGMAYSIAFIFAIIYGFIIFIKLGI